MYLVAFVYMILIIATTVLFTYTRLFQGTTLFVGRQLVSNNPLLPQGLQDVITPKMQTVRNYSMYVSMLLIVAYGWYFYKWYIGIGCLIIMMMLSSVIELFMPKEGSIYCLRIIKKGLLSKSDKYKKKGDTIRLDANVMVLSKLENFMKDLHSTK